MLLLLLTERFDSIYTELRHLGMDRSPFILVSLVGQELLANGDLRHAIDLLECALKIGTTSLKLKQSVLSALSSAHWKDGNIQSAAEYMIHDLDAAQKIGTLQFVIMLS